MHSKGKVFTMKNKKSGSTVHRIAELAKPLCGELGLELWDVKFEKEGATWYLRVFIDKDGGINIADCENFSRPFNKLLDETDPISQSYVFEVSGPGLGRELRKPEHFERFIGEKIRIRFIRARNGEKEAVCTLKGYSKPNITVQFEGSDDDDIISLSDCAYVKLNDDQDLFDIE